MNAVPYHDTTILFSWGFCYKFLHKRSHLEVFSTRKKIPIESSSYQYNTMMTRNTSIFTYKIIQSAAYSLIWLCRKWFLLPVFLSNDNIHFWFEDWPCPFIKLQKGFFSLKSCMQISALCVKFNDQSECNFTTIS